MSRDHVVTYFSCFFLPFPKNDDTHTHTQNKTRFFFHIRCFLFKVSFFSGGRGRIEPGNMLIIWYFSAEVPIEDGTSLKDEKMMAMIGRKRHEGNELQMFLPVDGFKKSNQKNQVQVFQVVKYPSFVPGSKLRLFPYNRGWSSTQY